LDSLDLDAEVVVAAPTYVSYGSRFVLGWMAKLPVELREYSHLRIAGRRTARCGELRV
jgi:hypothetical protein